ncbi:MAG: dockerin type I domain-containing protein [Candidatus Zixiibacteriota bacterium]
MKRLRAVIICFLLSLAFTAMAYPPPPVNYRISTPSPQIQNEEQIWTCPTDSNIVVALWRDFRLGYRQVGYGRSTDGGNTWTDSLITATDHLLQSDPVVDVDANGNIFLGYIDYYNNPIYQSQITIIKSSDGGLTFGPIVATAFNPDGLYDKEFITVDRTGGPYSGNLYMSWSDYPNDYSYIPIKFIRLQAGNTSFDPPVIVGPPRDFSYCGSGQAVQGGHFSQPLVGSDGSVYTFFYTYEIDSTYCEFSTIIAMTKSTDGGVAHSFPPQKIVRTSNYSNEIDGSVSAFSTPYGAADISGGPFDGNLYISYPDMDTANYVYNDYNIKLTKSEDGGASWTEPVIINDDATGSGAKFDQWHPWLFCNQEGTLIIVFYDQRLDPLSHTKYDIFASYSFDGGETFTTNHRITDESTNPYSFTANRDFNNRATKIGEYIGVTAFKDHINAAWTDGRNSNQEVWGANWITPILEPRLLSPANQAASEEMPLLKWAAAWKISDDSYRVEIASDDQFNDIIYSQMLDSNSIIPDAKLDQGSYFWRVKAFKLSNSDSTEFSETREFEYIKPIICGDADNNGVINILDITFLISYLYKNGTAPVSLWAADPNGSITINILDITYLITYLYKNGPAPICS